RVLAVQTVVAVEPPREARVLGGDGGCVLLVVPESRLPQLLLELGEPFPQPIRVKGNHGPSPAGPRSPRVDPRARGPGRPCEAMVAAAPEAAARLRSNLAARSAG